MAARKRFGQLVGPALAGGALVAALIEAGPAQADPITYLNDLHNAGIADANGDAALLQTGWKLCAQLADGAAPVDLRNLALQRSDGALGANGLTVQQADDLINYAKADLCP